MSRITGGESRQNELFKVIEKLRNTPIKTNENEEATNEITPTEKYTANQLQKVSGSYWSQVRSNGRGEPRPRNQRVKHGRCDKPNKNF